MLINKLRSILTDSPFDDIARVMVKQNVNSSTHDFVNIVFSKVTPWLNRKECSVVDSRIIIYTGSIDPATIKSRYIPTLSEIYDKIDQACNGSGGYNIISHSFHDYVKPSNISSVTKLVNEIDKEVSVILDQEWGVFSLYFIYRHPVWDTEEITFLYLVPLEIRDYVDK